MALRVVHVLYTLATGGMEKGITTVVRHSSPDFEHAVVCLSRSGAMAERLPPGTPVRELHKPPGNSLGFVRRVARALGEMRPDVVHTRNWAGHDGIAAARWAGIRAVVHGEHGWDIGDAAGRNRKRRFLRRLFQRWVREYTCVSRDIEEWLRRVIGIRRPITQIYNGVDTEASAPRDGRPVREELGLPASAFVVGIVGRLDPIKDHPTLFRAVADLRGDGLDARLLVVGEGPEEARLRGLAGEGVHFLGNRSDVPRLLASVDVFALVSLNEGISNTILEAMASGLPVLATRVGGNPELVRDGETGVLVPAGDAAAVTAALRTYARDPASVRRHGDAGRRSVVERFSIPAMVQGYEAVWKRAAAR